jgi:hypothetical protein
LKNKKEHKLEKTKTKIKDIIKKKKCKKGANMKKYERNFFLNVKKVEKIDKKGREKKTHLRSSQALLRFLPSLVVPNNLHIAL